MCVCGQAYKEREIGSITAEPLVALPEREPQKPLLLKAPARKILSLRAQVVMIDQDVGRSDPQTWAFRSQL